MGSDADKSRDYNKAIKLYKTSLSLYSDHPVVWSNMGYAYHRLQMHREAIECFDKSLSINPNLESAQRGKNLVAALLEGRGEVLLRSYSDQPKERGIMRANVQNTVTDIETRTSIGQEPREFRVETPSNPNPYDAIRQRAWNNRWQ
jgi:tetratricopeptide (TPR) repeat protein